MLIERDFSAPSRLFLLGEREHFCKLGAQSFPQCCTPHNTQSADARVVLECHCNHDPPSRLGSSQKRAVEMSYRSKSMSLCYSAAPQSQSHGLKSSDHSYELDAVARQTTSHMTGTREPRVPPRSTRIRLHAATDIQRSAVCRVRSPLHRGHAKDECEEV